MINGAHHVSLSTADMEAMLYFYRDLLGLRQVSDGGFGPGEMPAFETVVGLRDTRVRSAWLHVGNVFVEIFEYAEPTPTKLSPARSCDVGLRHIAFDVTDIDDEYDRLKAAGITFLSAPQTIGGVVRAVYLRDPDGNIVEFQEVLPGGQVDRAHIVGLPQ